MALLPALFISHGAPTLVLEDSPARHFLQDYAATLPLPRAIIVVSAHWESAVPSVGSPARFETIHDFAGFPAALYQLRYPALGDPPFATRVVAALAAAGLTVARENERGLDHGAWVPLMLLYPAADVPVISVSIQPTAGPAHHLAVGRALAPLRQEGVLILASGSLTHNLEEWRSLRPSLHSPAPDWVTTFTDWVAAAVVNGAVDSLLHYRREAPFARRNHPSEEHLLPLFVALGTGGERGKRIHRSQSHAVLAMDAYAMG